MGNLLKPKNDLIFKRIFGTDENLDVLTGFLKSVLRLPADEYDEVILCNPNTKADRADDKIGILDIKIKTTTGKIIDVEIQLKVVPQFRERIMFYASKMFTEQINRGDKYGAIKQVIPILIVDDKLFTTEDDKYHHRFTLYDTNAQLEFMDILEVHTLELLKLPEATDGSSLWNWLKLLNSEEEEDFDMLAQTSPQMEKAVTIVRHLSMDEQFRFDYEQSEKRRRDLMAFMDEATEKGIAKGKAEGKAEGIVEGMAEGEAKAKTAIAKSMLAIGLSLDQITQTTGLTVSQIKTL
ncbi:hypothetical protein FACS1894167_01850 [Synergistales bacterium]|nr:hypothetical protein FACS1894167_01850 [Synergistales bacterium]